MSLLDEIISSFDDLVNKYDLEKIKTIGDEYFVAAGVPTPDNNHAEHCTRIASDMLERLNNFKTPSGESLSMRIGMNTGPLVGGVIGKRKFVYDAWGDTVNVGSRMESEGVPGEIQITEVTKRAIEHQTPVNSPSRNVEPFHSKGECR